MEFVATTIPGLEEIAGREIEEITGSRASRHHRGRVRFSGEETDIFLLNYCARSLHRILVLITEGNFSTLMDLYRKTYSIDFFPFIQSHQSFAVRAERYGIHSFSSMDVERVIGQAVIDAYERRIRKRLHVDLESPTVLFRCEVRKERFWIGLDTTGLASLHRRGYRVCAHPAPLKPSIAYSLVRLSGWNSDESLMDPMCGSGTLCIEASMWANRLPPGSGRSFAFRDLSWVDTKRFEELKETIDSGGLNGNLDVSGCDISGKHVGNAGKNARHAGVSPYFFEGNALEIALDADRIVTNPPYGLRVGSLRKIRKLYEGFLSNLVRHRWKRVVILTARPGLLADAPVKRRLDIAYGNLPTAVLIL